VYLLQFFAVCIFELLGKHDWKLLVTMPLTGLIQSIIAVCTFTFLPTAKEEDTQGYYHSTRVMSYDFIKENLYFAGLLMFQSAYLAFNKSIRENTWFLPLEVMMVFFPYYTVRGFFPKSSFRSSTKDGNRFAQVTKVFYMTGKHFNGYYLNYLAFLGCFGDSPLTEWSLLRKMLILGGWGTTIAMFLQTLKFRRYISATTAMLLYVGVFPLFWSVYVALLYVGWEHAWLGGLTFIGLVLNFGSRTQQVAWQTCLAVLLVTMRLSPELLPGIVGGVIGK
jgi:hypothetical protein